MLLSNRNMKLVALFFLAFFLIAIIGINSTNQALVRPLIFFSCFTLLLLFSIYYKEKVIMFFIFYLALMGFFRRALIPIAGWSAFDPLLILGPIMTVIIAFILLWENKKIISVPLEKPDKMMNILLVIGCFQILNPFSGSLIAGVIASIYIIIPWLWYYIAFYKITRRDVNNIFNIVEGIGVLIAAYGIFQSFYGLLPFEMKWVEITGYAALYLADDMVRAIGTFPSAQEFVYFTMITFIVGFTRLLTGRFFLFHFFVVIVTLFSIFLASARTVIFFMAIAIFLVIGLKMKTVLRMIISSICAISVIAMIWLSLPKIDPNWFGVAAPAVEHMIVGLIDPLSEDQTGLGHIERFVDGLFSIFTNPVGYGIASITTAANKSTTTTAMSTEVDISNMVVALGIGGIIYSLIVVVTIFKTIRLINTHKEGEYLIILGIFIASLGQWLNGGFYLCSIIIWLLVGWIHRQYSIYRGEINASSGR